MVADFFVRRAADAMRVLRGCHGRRVCFQHQLAVFVFDLILAVVAEEFAAVICCHTVGNSDRIILRCVRRGHADAFLTAIQITADVDTFTITQIYIVGVIALILVPRDGRIAGHGEGTACIYAAAGAAVAGHLVVLDARVAVHGEGAARGAHMYAAAIADCRVAADARIAVHFERAGYKHAAAGAGRRIAADACCLAVHNELAAYVDVYAAAIVVAAAAAGRLVARDARAAVHGEATSAGDIHTAAVEGVAAVCRLVARDARVVIHFELGTAEIHAAAGTAADVVHLVVGNARVIVHGEGTAVHIHAATVALGYVVGDLRIAAHGELAAVGHAHTATGAGCLVFGDLAAVHGERAVVGHAHTAAVAGCPVFGNLAAVHIECATIDIHAAAVRPVTDDGTAVQVELTTSAHLHADASDVVGVPDLAHIVAAIRQGQRAVTHDLKYGAAVASLNRLAVQADSDVSPDLNGMVDRNSAEKKTGLIRFQIIAATGQIPIIARITCRHIISID